MARANTKKQLNSEVTYDDAFQPSKEDKPTGDAESKVHSLGPGKICNTGPRGYATPRDQPPEKIILDATKGFIPLWVKGTTLHWRFRESSMAYFANSAAATAEIRNLLGEALLEWGTAAPIRFTENRDLWDFEIVMKPSDECNIYGCALAGAFFPDSGRHELELYPKLFTQTRKEMVDTFIHEIGHIFGLRHFFAKESEKLWPSEIYGTHSKFSIMNYGELSELTDADRDDLKRLYLLAWSGALTHINGTPIQLVKPYHTLAPESIVAINQTPAVFLPQPMAANIQPSMVLQRQLLTVNIRELSLTAGNTSFIKQLGQTS